MEPFSDRDILHEGEVEIVEWRTGDDASPGVAVLVDRMGESRRIECLLEVRVAEFLGLQ